MFTRGFLKNFHHAVAFCEVRSGVALRRPQLDHRESAGEWVRGLSICALGCELDSSDGTEDMAMYEHVRTVHDSVWTKQMNGTWTVHHRTIYIYTYVYELDMNYVSVCFQRTGTSRFFKGADTTNVGRIMEINGRHTDKNGTGEILFAVYTPSQKPV